MSSGLNNADVPALSRGRLTCVLSAQPHRRLFYNAPVKTWDVIIIGGGIIGLSLSIALRKRGATVLVVERGEPGREASHAAGGMLVDCPFETLPALRSLATASARMYPEFAYELEVESGMKVDLRDYGTILLSPSEHFPHPEFSEAALTSAALAELETPLADPNQPGILSQRAQRRSSRTNSRRSQDSEKSQRRFLLR